MLNKIIQAYEARDLEALDKLATPLHRKLNKKENFRSVLMVSANKIKHLQKIPELAVDAVILNLEDGVAPEEKPFALVLAAIFLTLYRECDKKLIVRVNALDEGGFDEIAYLNQFMPDAIRVPKIQTPKEVRDVLHLLNDGIELHLSIETASAWHNLAALAVNHRVKAFYLGALDLFADMGLPQNLIAHDNPTLQYLLAHFLLTSRSMQVKPVSFVFQEYKDEEQFKKWLELEKQMGYDAKGCITPKQAAMINEYFVNKEEEIKRAKVIVKLFEMHRDEGVTGFVDEEYGFIDEPVYKGALKLLEEEQSS